MPYIHNLNGSIQISDWELLAQVAHKFGWTIHWEDGRPYQFRKMFGLITPYADAYGGFDYANYRVDMNVQETYMNIAQTIQVLTHGYNTGD